MQNYQVNSEDLNKYTVAIQKPGGDSVLGTGIIVTDDGLIVTCYHVIGNVRNNTLDYKTADIYFPSAPEIKGHTNVLEEYSDSSLDIAFLRLREKELPKQVAVATLSEEVIPQNDYQSFGFRESEIVRGGLYSAGTIQGKTHEETSNPLQEIIQLTIDHNRSKVPHGMSGAPVLDTITNRVIGVISSSMRSETHDFAIPINTILQVYPELKQKNEGLKPISNFLTKLNTQYIWYQKIDELYVPPLEFDDIEKTLNQYRLVFITRTKEYGKTYTAVKLLWEYYKKGYEPKYVLESAKEELSETVDKLLGLDEKLKKHVIYFDDPVGKTAYLPNEKFENNITRLIDILDNQDACIIITMREEVYQKSKQIGKNDLKKFVKKLNIGNNSYGYEERKSFIVMKFA